MGVLTPEKLRIDDKKEIKEDIKKSEHNIKGGFIKVFCIFV